ncbi:GNAT family N-acetyltransferase [Chitinophaga pendula]|uniref:GNAT family N-acetyltransferase n=1 Tax=Chitinophaga TaxID=79328 RepID=UPI000BAF7191|nr:MULTISPECIES: GNAT family N-acetyltransferase [Chitinophaga]ASZ10726.1 GNAT family N-acetyltransferase [Chitinophaga sp. MD30]UCJ06297.1 GNAT family N-acetyltransferase [Chitinophaga pendula]
MIITPSTTSDIPAIMDIYQQAINYQIANGYNIWPLFDEAVINNEIREQRRWHINIDNQIAAVFAVAYIDPIIWKGHDHDPAIYLHKIATHTGFKGNNCITRIVDWAHTHAQQKNKHFIRMDTWADNERLTNYYIAAGFKLLGKQLIPETTALPPHYWNIYVNLFEIALHRS